MATALHPQTILATKYAREPITDPFGFPLRLRTATKLGFKNPKWITAIEVTNTLSAAATGRTAASTGSAGSRACLLVTCGLDHASRIYPNCAREKSEPGNDDQMRVSHAGQAPRDYGGPLVFGTAARR